MTISVYGFVVVVTDEFVVPLLYTKVYGAGPVNVTDKFTDVVVQIVCVPVNDAVGATGIESTIASDTAVHGPVPSGSFVVKFNVTEPAVFSAAVGV